MMHVHGRANIYLHFFKYLSWLLLLPLIRLTENESTSSGFFVANYRIVIISCY